MCVLQYYIRVVFIRIGVPWQPQQAGSSHQHAQIPVHRPLCANSPEDLAQSYQYAIRLGRMCGVN